jgi:RNA polymerase sigma factor (sigma-70 family)
MEHQTQDQFAAGRDDELAAWLRALFKDTVARAIRSSSSEPREASFSLNEALASPSAHPGIVSAEGLIPTDKIAAQKEQLLRLAAGLARLPDDQRAVLEMKHLHGLSLTEICDQTGRSKLSVVGLLYHGLKALRGVLDDPSAEEAGGHP